MLLKLALCVLLVTVGGVTANGDSGNLTTNNLNVTSITTPTKALPIISSSKTSDTTSNDPVTSTELTAAGSSAGSPSSQSSVAPSDVSTASTETTAAGSSAGSPSSQSSVAPSDVSTASTETTAAGSSAGSPSSHSSVAPSDVSTASTETTAAGSSAGSPSSQSSVTPSDVSTASTETTAAGSSAGSPSSQSSVTPSDVSTTSTETTTAGSSGRVSKTTLFSTAGSSQVTSNDTDSNNSTSTESADETTSAMITSTSKLCAKNHCKNQGKCVVHGSEAACTCTPAWTGDICQEDVDECQGDTTHDCNATTSQCENKMGDYVCKCLSGYRQGASNKICEDIDECRITNNCTKNQDCLNLVGSYECECKNGTYRDGEVCKDLQNVKVERTWNITSDVNFNDPTSKSYKNLVEELEANMTEELKANNTDKIYRLKITSLRKGSIIATAIVQLNSTQKLIPSVGFVKKDLSDEDFCVFDMCDSKSTDCRGVAAAHSYECVCKKNYEPIPGVREYCQYQGECTSNSNCPDSGQQCEEKDGVYRCISNVKSCSKTCKNSGTCVTLANGNPTCRCANNYTGDDCGTQVVPLTSKKDLENILIGVGVGLGSLALFCSIALIIVCCSDRSKAKPYSIASKSNHLYVGDDVTIDTWEPSLPRPKIKAGAFRNSAADSMEMNERDGVESRELGAGAENPAFIPEADYEGGRGRLVNGKKRDSGLVYF